MAFQFNSIKALLFVSVAGLTACGGSGSDSVQSEQLASEPAPNTAPVAEADAVTTLNSEPVTIDVLGNDTDLDGDTLSVLSINAEGLLGEASIENGVINYKPPAAAMGQETFTYEVSDGESSTEATVTVTNTQAITIAGIVTDAPVANAKVSVTLGEETFTSDASATGEYELLITVSQDSAPLEIIARGIDEQSHVKLVSLIDAPSVLIEQSDDQRVVSDERYAGAKVTHISTASALLFKEQLGDDKALKSYDEFVAQQNFEDVLEVAGFIKLLADNPDFNLPEDADTLSFFEASEEDVSEEITQYLQENGYIEEDGSVSQAYTEALDGAIEETLADESLAINFEDATVAGNTFVSYVVQGAIMYPYGAGYDFAQDGGGKMAEVTAQSTEAVVADFNWSLRDGDLTLTFAEGNGSESYPVCDSQHAIGDVFGEEALSRSLAMCESNEIPGHQVKITTYVESESWSLLESKNNVHRIARAVDYNYTLELDHDSDNPVTFTASEVKHFSSLYSTNENSLFSSSADVEDTNWSFLIPSSVDFYLAGTSEVLETVSGLMYDRVSFNADGTLVTLLGEDTGTWTFVDGVVTFSVGTKTLSLKPLVEVDNTYAALLTVGTGDGKISVGTQLIPAYDDIAENVPVSTELPEAWTSYISGTSPSCLDGDITAVECYFGFYFNADGTFGRIHTYYENDGELYFKSDKEEWSFQWMQDNNVIQMDGLMDNEWELSRRQRKWHLLSISDSGLLRVLEYEYYGSDYDNEPGIDLDWSINPRINVLKQEDLAELYPNVWNDSEVKG